MDETTERETPLRMALRHVRGGRECIKRQYDVIERLRSHGLTTGQAEAVLQWLKDTQVEFENDYERMLRGGEEKLQEAGSVDPRADWPEKLARSPQLLP
jgi:hypothetical protein